MMPLTDENESIQSGSDDEKYGGESINDSESQPTMKSEQHTNDEADKHPPSRKTLVDNIQPAKDVNTVIAMDNEDSAGSSRKCSGPSMLQIPGRQSKAQLPFTGRSGSVHWSAVSGSVRWSGILGDGHDEVRDDNQVSWWTQFLRSIRDEQEVYIRSTMIPTKITSTTGAVFRNKENAEWSVNTNNLEQFFIPTKYVDHTAFPIKMMVELWEMDTRGMDKYIASHVIELRPVTIVPDLPRQLKFKLHDGPSNPIGTLTANVSYTETLNAGTHQKLRAKLASNSSEQIDQETPMDLTFGMMEIEFLKFEAIDPKSKWTKYGILMVLFVAPWSVILSLTAIMTAVEDWSFLKSWYFINGTVTGVGYGDVFPETSGGEAWASIIAIMFNLMKLTLIALMSHWILDRHHAKSRSALNSMKRLEILRTHCEEEIDIDQRGHGMRGTEESDIRDNVHRAQQLEEARILSDHEIYKSRIEHDWVEIGMFVVGIILWHLMWAIYFTSSGDHPMSWSAAIYFGIITSTAVGFGDYHAEGNEDRMEFISLMVAIGVALWGYFAGVLCIYINEAREEVLEHDRDLERAINTLEDIRSFAQGDEKGAVSQREFLQQMLVNMGLVEEDVIQTINERFAQYGGEGALVHGQL